ncbi:MAG: sulfatase-like hydrolase/transferase [Magnetococcales bacterium]|nr:sulfatase-like hydrolase/transferase [Magnetococcales bacterium]
MRFWTTLIYCVCVALVVVPCLNALDLTAFLTSHSNYDLELLPELLIAVSVLTVILVVASAWWWLFLGVLVTLAVFGATVLYYRAFYSLHLTTRILAAVFETTLSESSEFIDGVLPQWLAVAVIMALTIFVMAQREKVGVTQRSFRWSVVVVAGGLFWVSWESFRDFLDGYARYSPWVVLLLLLAALLSRFPDRNHQRRIAVGVVAVLTVTWQTSDLFNRISEGELFEREPFRILGLIGDTISWSRWLERRNAKLHDLSTLPSHFHAEGKEDLVVVVIIGEAARSDRFQIAGYHRPTTPRLMQRPELIVYPDVTACATLTFIAIPCMLTRDTAETLPLSELEEGYDERMQLVARESSFIPLFAKHGFETAWISVNPVFNRANSPTTHLMYGVGFSWFHNPISWETKDHPTWDEEMLPVLDRFLKKHPGRSLIMLHGKGSHWRYTQRYPKSFQRFSPVCKGAVSRCSQRRLDNAYDNTIVYTDYLIDSVIQRLEQRNALVIYLSDHAESLGENGLYLHGNNAPVEYRVPMIVWASQRFQQANAEGLALMRNRQKQPINHAHLFHTVVDCSGIESEVVDPSFSLCHEHGNTSE